MNALFQDSRFALRAARRSPGFAVVAVLTLALGIGANSAMFSVVHAVLLRPLPYPDPDRLVNVYTDWEKRGGAPRDWTNPADFYDWRAQTSSSSKSARETPSLSPSFPCCSPPSRSSRVSPPPAAPCA